MSFVFFISLFRTLNVSYLDSLGVRMLPNYADPHHNRCVYFYDFRLFLLILDSWLL